MRAVQKALIEKGMRGKKVRKMTRQGARNVTSRAQTLGMRAQTRRAQSGEEIKAQA